MTGSRHFWRRWLTGTHCVGLALTVGVGSPPAWANTDGPAAIAVNAPLSAPPRIFPTQSVRKDAPNILVIMTDDVGFGASAPFGGPIATPTFAELARSGVRFNNFHTTGLCSPTRAALLTGRNPHEVGFGNVSEMAVGYPGYNSLMPKSAASFARVFRDNGYGTAMFGKHHNVPDWQSGHAGPFDQWPTGLGFEYFYGFLGGATNQWAPAIVENTLFREPPRDQPGYILDRDLADHAVQWLRDQTASAPDKPFLLYYAPGSAHSPHQAPADWIARFKGKFDQGWDRMREETFARQKATHVIPENARLTPRPAEIPAWDSLTPHGKAAAARMMEVYAAQLAYCDNQIGRVIDEVRRLGRYDNTIIVYIQGDNGGSGEGGVEGTTDQSMAYAGRRQTMEELYAQIDRMGGPLSENNYPVGWAWAMNTPFQWIKQIAGYRGANTNGVVVSWPGHMTATGEMRTQFEHVVDIAPTLYAAAGIAPPQSVDGVAQMPLAGESFLPLLSAPKAHVARSRQYYEVVANLGIHDGDWEAVTRPRRLPWVPTVGDQAGKPLQWQLYNVARDYSQAEDLASANPAKLSEMEAAFDAEARKRQVYPIDNSLMERMAPANRPYAVNGKSSFTFHGVITRFNRSEFPSTMNRSWSLSADVTLSGGNGTVATQGGRFGGWGLVLIGGKPVFAYRASGQAGDLTRIEGTQPLGPGRHTFTLDFAYEGPGFGKGGTFTLAADGQRIGQARVARTMPFVVSETADIGTDTGSPIIEDYAVPFPLEGMVERVRIDLGSAGGASGTK